MSRVYHPVPTLVQVQRYRTVDEVVVETVNLETTSHREYEDVLRDVTSRLRTGETTRAVTNDSRYFVGPYEPNREDEQ